MRALLCCGRGLVCLGLFWASGAALACNQLPAGQTLWVRLTAPVSTATARKGDPVHAVLTEDLVCDNDVVLAKGALIDGVVESRRKVGWGIRHETAALELAFTRATTAQGRLVPLAARVEEVANAREVVHNGVIQGIRSSDTFQGRINSRLIHLPTWNPYSDPVLIVYKAVFPIFPEPEIFYPTGTDLRLRTTRALSSPLSPSSNSAPVPDSQADHLDGLVGQLPWRVITRKNVGADLINIVFLGSQTTVQAAFHEAGWDSADTVSRRTVFKGLYALLDNSGYPREPMTTFYLDGRPEDMNWQKSLNSYDRRDHLRIWRWPSAPGADTVWLSSSTHDTGAVLAVKYRGFVHHIAPEIDDERATVVRDLDFAGCVRSVSYVARPAVPTATRNAIGDAMHTDGLVAVVSLQPCHTAEPRPDVHFEGSGFRSGNHVFRFARRQILTFRSDILRANILYGAYDLGRMTFAAIRRRPAPAGYVTRRPILTPPASVASQSGPPEPISGGPLPGNGTDLLTGLPGPPAVTFLRGELQPEAPWPGVF